MNVPTYLQLGPALIMLLFSPIPLSSAILYIDQDASGANNGASWENAYTDLQDALAVALPGDELWIAEGVYYPSPATGNRDIAFEIPNGVKMYGGFAGTETSLNQRDWQAHPAILSGANGTANDTSDDAYTVVYMEHCDSTTLIDGIEVREGLADSEAVADNYIGRRKNGGGVYIYAEGDLRFANPVFANCRFAANVASERGGGIAALGVLGGVAVASFRNCIFSNNYAGRNGAGLLMSSIQEATFTALSVYLDSCQFLFNHLDDNGRYLGAAIYGNTNVRNIGVTDCFFFRNGQLPHSGSSCLLVEGGDENFQAEMRRCRFLNNRGGAVMGGGGGRLLADSCTFSGSILEDSLGVGVPLSLYEGEVEVQGCTFENNASIRGAAMQFNFTEGRVRNCRFYKNYADYIGSAFLFRWRNQLVFQDCFFEENTARFGGLLAFRDRYNEVDFLNCIFTGNRADSFGGVIYSINTDGSDVRFTNCLFYKNTARKGGLWYLAEPGCRMRLYNSIIYGNTSDSIPTQGLMDNARAELYNCLLDVSSCERISKADTFLFVEYNWETLAFDSFIIASTQELQCTANVYSQNPLFADAEGGDFRLLPGSPAINAGYNAILDFTGLLYDLDGNARVSGDTVDIGPYEFPLEISQPFSAVLDSIRNASCFNSSDGAVWFATAGEEPFTYHWQHGEASGTGTTGLAAGSYAFTVSDAAGRSQLIENVVVGQAPQLFLPFDVTGISCNGEADGSIRAPVFGGTPPYAFSWSNGAQDSVLNGLAAGLYSLTVTDSNGCTRNGSVNLMGPAVLDLSAETENPDCNNQASGSIALNIQGGTSPYDIFWNTGQNGAKLEGLPAGNYQAWVVDANGCRDSLFLSLAEPPALEVAINSASPTCYSASNGALDAIPTGGTPPYTLEWAGLTNDDLDELAAGTYSLSLTDANGCTFEEQVVLEGPDSLSALFTTLPPSTNSAADGQIVLEEAAGGTPPYTYSWSTGANTPSVNNLPAGMYTLTLTDAKGCEREYSFALSPLTSVNDIRTALPLQLYPNPSGVRQEVHLEWGRAIPSAGEVAVYDAIGQCLYRLKPDAGLTHFSLPSPSVAGWYCVIFQWSDGTKVYLPWIVNR